MGGLFSYHYINGHLPDHIPEKNSAPTFDPQFGFKSPRIPRESKLTKQEMKALRLKRNESDYCAHLLLDYQLCYKRYFPIFGFCSEEMEAHRHCELEDYILRMKEFEREKRLRMREMRKQGISVS